MKLYNYQITFDNKLNCSEEHGFNECLKTYRRENPYPRVIHKDDVGEITGGVWHPYLWLTERDDEKAKELFRSHYESQISEVKRRCEETCQHYFKILGSLSKE